MQLIIIAILFSAFLWWFSTGVIFYLNARPANTHRWSLLAASVLLVVALYGLWASAGMQSVLASFIAFCCGLAIWGWHTMSYYMGIITGPRSEPCPPDCQGMTRFLRAFETDLYHELAIIATVGLMLVLTWQQPNPFGLWTFLLLWAMHVSAKLNVFLGVRNMNEEFLPQRIHYLTSYFGRKSINLLFPFSVAAGTLITVLLALQASAADAPTWAVAGYVLLATLMALAVFEHWFMVLPIQAEALWRWSLKPKVSDARSKAQHDDAVKARPTRSKTDDSVTSMPDY